MGVSTSGITPISPGNDAASRVRVQASISSDYDCTTTDGAGTSAKHALGATWLVEVGTVGDVKFVDGGGEDVTIPSANWIAGVPKLVQAKLIYASGTDAEDFVFYWR